ncbi:hypothetical protein GDO81_001819 [Engystomops pustulosus]|uniref:G-protein coupled receptors family 1 profile domain-containing protein n=1 Tax=Engystomops pustulosus TaxID=76066 RepID=A0AAV7DHU5_ENGPU|nr:hypothetical protein GDO81_001819 [Engystomops pustulosus]
MFVTLLVIFIVTLAGNLLIILIIRMDNRLHSPMYFFLANLSFAEMSGIITVVPKLLTTFVVENSTISKTECMMQCFFYFFIFSSVFLILAVMSCDRYLAICHPFRYTPIMRHSVCIHLVCACFIISLALILYPAIMLSKLPYCGRVVDHFFCDSAALLKLICINTILLKLYGIIASVFILIIPAIITVISYVFIVYTVIMIPTSKGRQKTFSTCVSHLAMVTLVFGSAIFIQVRPPRHYNLEKDKMIVLVSTMLAPLLNPFIYTLRNQKVKDCIKDVIKKTKQKI